MLPFLFSRHVQQNVFFCHHSEISKDDCTMQLEGCTKLFAGPLAVCKISDMCCDWWQAWTYWNSAPEHVKLGVLGKLQTGSKLARTELFDRGKFFCEYIQQLWPEGGPLPVPSGAYKELMHLLASEKKDVSRVLTKWDFTWEPLVLCEFQRQPEEVQWQTVYAVQKATANGSLSSMQKAERVAWFASVLDLAAANFAAAQLDAR